MKTKTKKTLAGYVVYAWVPVNVKVKASSVDKAQELALTALNRTRPLTLETDDDSLPIYIDGGVPCKLDDKSGPQELEIDEGREYATEERP